MTRATFPITAGYDKAGGVCGDGMLAVFQHHAAGFEASNIMKRTRLIIFILLTQLIFGALAESAGKQPLTVEAIYRNPGLMGYFISFSQWSSDGREWIFLDPESPAPGIIRAISGDQGKTRVLVDLRGVIHRFQTLAALVKQPAPGRETVGNLRFSPDEKHLLFVYQGDIYEYRLLSRSLRRWTESLAVEEAVQYSPDGSKIAFCRDHNLYIIDRESSQEWPVTIDGNSSRWYGQPDWVTREEFGLHDGYWWSPDSRNIAILCLDETAVPTYPLIDWSATPPSVRYQKFPRAGDANPVPAVWLYQWANHRLIRLPLGGLKDQYLPRILWTPDSRHILAEELDRRQRHLRLQALDISDLNTRTLVEEHSSTWLNVHDLIYTFSSGDEFLWGSERSGFMHLYRYRMDGTLLGAVTSGMWAVTSLDHVDENLGRVFITTTHPTPMERHLYSVSLADGKMERLTSSAGTHSASISPKKPFWVHRQSTDCAPPAYSMRSLEDPEISHNFLRSPPDLLNSYLSADYEYMEIRAEDGAVLPARMLKPDSFDPARQYPVLIYVYGGPLAQTVVNDWAGSYHLWHQMMAQHGFIVFSLDNRGSHGRGRLWESAIHRRLGQVELSDQMAGVHYLKSLPYVDKDRVGIWGWSYGGMLTCLALTRFGEEFKAGAAVAPVADWLDYDSIYTERYMGLPQDNPGGYQSASPIHYMEQLGDPLLLMHGLADDNVHFQHTVRLVESLVRLGKEFETVYYPGMKHDIGGTNSRIHLFKSMTDFFNRHLGVEAKPSPPD